MLAQATGGYRARPSIGPLHEHFACTWVNRLPEIDTVPIVVVPDGCIDLEWLGGTLRIAGPDRKPRTETLAPGTTVIGFRFRAGTAVSWLGLPASEIVDGRVPLEQFWGAEAHRLADAANAACDVATRVHTIESALLRRAPSIASRHRDMRAAYALIATGAPPDRSLIPWLARELALSERTLRRRFDEAFGYGPKTLDRILRFQRFLELARRAPTESAARLAAAVGYADQAHLTRECRRLAAATPGEVLGRLTDAAAA
jgi:AraC-like DNA-binding protein